MRRWRRLIGWLCVWSCLFAVVITPALGAGMWTVPGQDTDNTATRVEVHTDGSATWTVRIRTRLATDEEFREYQSFQQQFRNNTSRYLDPFRQRMTGVVATAGNATGREMHARNVTATTSIQQVPRRWGIVTYRFTWTNMARTTERGVAVGDVFQGGFYLATNDTLTLVAPANYTVASATPKPAEKNGDTVTWTGQHNFADEHPSARFAPASGTGQSTQGGGPLNLRAWWLVATVLAGGTVVGYGLMRTGAVPGTSDETGPDAGGADESAAASSGGSETTPAHTQQLLTDADRVEQLLDQQGGRMRQADVAEELDWSASKTSRVVSDMAEDGTVEKLRIGRENVLELLDDDTQ